jgi:hypothetical protein
MNRVSMLLVLLIVLAGCSTTRQQSKRPVPAARIAVLPAESDGKHPDGALLVRDLVSRWLAARGYVTVPTDVVDRALSTAGVSEPARPQTAQLITVARETGADAIAAIDLLDFTSVNRGFSSERRVALAVRLIDPANGHILWQNTDQMVTTTSTKNPTRALFDYVRGWGAQAYEKAMRSPLFSETNSLVERLLQDLPAYKPA